MNAANNLPTHMHSVDLWLLEPSRLKAGAEAWFSLLDEGEKERHDRLRQPADRLAFVASHGLLRRALSERCPEVDPASWRFTVSPSGKPELSDSSLRFNLSHCRELVAVAVTQDTELGVDVEPVDSRHCSSAVAARVYGPSELADLEAQPDEAHRVERFFERWTVKEAWVKATGVGLNDDLPSLEMRLGVGRAWVERGDRRPWQFHWWTPAPKLKLAVCVGTASPLSVEPRWWAV